jgi:predicted PurR-regulated permease PerM
MKPFLTPLLWATMIVVATWPGLVRLQGWLRGSRRFAVVVMTMILLMALILPLFYAVWTIATSVHTIVDWAGKLETLTVPPPPTWVASLPLVGAKIASTWESITNSSFDVMVSYVTPYLPKLAEWFLSQAGSAGLLIFQFLLTVIICAILYTYGETASAGVRRFAFRLAGGEGERVAILAAKAIRGVALGVVVTALIQSLLAGMGLLVVGLPAVELLTAVIFMLCLAQLSPLVVLIPAVVWLYWSGQDVGATALLLWAIPVGMIDNFVRPLLIRRGADLPLLLVFAGVIGGLLSLGIAGIFIGPTVLAVTFTLLKSWVDAGDRGNGQKTQASTY